MAQALKNGVSNLATWATGPGIPSKIHTTLDSTTQTVQQASTRLNSTLDEVDKTAQKLHDLLDNPQDFFEKTVKGILKGISPKQETDSKQKSEGWLADQIKGIFSNGVNSTSVFILEQFLKNLTAFDLDPEDANLKATSLETLNSAKKEPKSLQETVETVWKKLNGYHILFGSFRLNEHPSSNELLKSLRKGVEDKREDIESDTDGVNPSDDLAICQGKYRDLCEKFQIAPKVEEKKKVKTLNPDKRKTVTQIKTLEEMKQATNQKIEKFSQKLIHFSTMYLLDRLRGSQIDPSEYNKILEKENLDFKETFLSQYAPKGKIGQFFFRQMYDFFFWLIEPLIGGTISNAVLDGLREFLNNDKEFLNFIETKFKEMGVYFEDIENSRIHYLENRPLGGFEQFLQNHITTYGTNKYTEAELIRLFEKYIVHEYVPRPEVKIRNWRIPLLSSFFEWVTFSLRKQLVLYFLNKTQLVDRILTQGTNAVHSAQLGLKTLFLQKLNHIAKRLEQSAVIENSKEEIDGSEFELKKAEVITSTLHPSIQLLSTRFLRFIEIEACNYDAQELKKLNEGLSEKIEQFLKVCNSVLEWRIFSPKDAIANATTNILEATLLSLFDNRDMQIEEELQQIFSILDASFNYVSPDDTFAKETRFRFDCSVIDGNLKSQMEKISNLAAELILKNELKKAPGDTHLRFKKFLEEEKKEILKYLTQFESVFEELDKSPQNLENLSSAYFKKIHISIVNTIENFMSHISQTLNSSQLKECYTDLQGDLHNLFAFYIAGFNHWYPHGVKIGEEIRRLEVKEQKMKNFMDAHLLLEELYNTNLSHEQTLEKLNHISQLLEEQQTLSLQDDHPLKLLEDERKTLNQARTRCQNLVLLEEKMSDSQKMDQRITELEAFKNKLTELSQLMAKDQTGSQNSESRNIQTCYRELMSTKTEGLLEVLNLLRSNDTKKLYHVFHPKRLTFKRQISPFVVLDNLINREKRLLVSLKEEAKVIQTKLISSFSTPKEVQSEREKQLKEIKECEITIKAKCNNCSLLADNKISEMYDAIEQSHLMIRKSLKEMKTITTYFKEPIENLHVKGCLSLGEMKFVRTLLPGFLPKISDVLNFGMRTTMSAFGKPFHYKQFALRMIFLDRAQSMDKKKK